MAEITGLDIVRAGLLRLAQTKGPTVVRALLERLGIGSVNSIPESAFDSIVAACPDPNEGGFVVALGDNGKPLSTAETLNKLALDMAYAKADNERADDIKEVLNNAPTLSEGFNRLGKALGGKMKTAKGAAQIRRDFLNGAK